MTDNETMHDVEELVELWKTAAEEAASARRRAEKVWCVAFTTSEAKTAEADLAANEEKLGADHMKIRARATQYLVEFALAAVGGSK